MTWSDRLCIREDGGHVTKRYRLDSMTEARQLAADVRRYTDRLAARLPVVDPIRVTTDDETVVVVQSTDRGPTLRQELLAALDGSFTDSEVTQLLLSRFEDAADLLSAVPIVRERRHDLFDGRRYGVGVYLQPNGLFVGDGPAVAKLVPPLELDDSGLPAFESVPDDVLIPAKLAYYLWMTPIGVLHNLATSLLSIVATGVSEPVYQSTRGELTNRVADRLARDGYDRRLARLIGPDGYKKTYRSITRLLNRQSNPDLVALVEVAGGES